MDTEVGQAFEVTLRGFSPRELALRAEERCASHFQGCRFRFEQTRCVPCVCSLGGRVRLYEARFVASPLTEPAPASH
jgi:hypothetical protein